MKIGGVGHYRILLKIQTLFMPPYLRTLIHGHPVLEWLNITANTNEKIVYISVMRLMVMNRLILCFRYKVNTK